MKKNFDELCVGDKIIVEVGEEGNWIEGYICSINVTRIKGANARTYDRCTIDMIYVSEGSIRHLEFCSECSEMVLDYLGHDEEELVCLLK